MMFKILLLQRYYNISDEQTEYQILDRLSFMRFLRLGLKDRVPDCNTIWNFREALTVSGVIERIFEIFTHQLTCQGLLSIVDASFIEVSRQRNNKEIKEIPKRFTENPNILCQEARWTKKNDKKIYEKGARYIKLTAEQIKSNHQKSKIRARVEHIFGFMKKCMQGLYIYTIGLRRAKTAVGLTN